MKFIETDFGPVPVDDDSFDTLSGGLHKELIKELNSIFKYYPQISMVSVVDGRIGLWGNGERRKFIRIQFTADYATPTEARA